MTKTLQQIKDEYAKEKVFDSWANLSFGGIKEIHLNEIAIRYAKEINKELVEMLVHLDRVGGLGHDTHERIDKLINKHKGGQS